jgi:hypothetical protein
VIKPVRGARAALARGVTLHLKLTVTFTPANGRAPTTVTRRLTINGTKRRRPLHRSTGQVHRIDDNSLGPQRQSSATERR